jgi:hypothetical protein
VQKFRVRLKGFRFMAFVPEGQKLATGEDGVATEAVTPALLAPAKNATQVPCDWLLVEAKSQREAEKAFMSANGIKKVLAPFVVEVVGGGK